MVQAPETGTLDMKQVMMREIQDESHRDVQCGKCQNIDENYEPQYVRTQKVIIIKFIS